jgi:hypothetical protein
MDLKLKSTHGFTSPLCDNNKINSGVHVSVGNMANNEVINELMTSLFI